MRRAIELLQLLADGLPHPGAELAAAMGISRAAVWNHIERLRHEGVAIAGAAAQGYHLPGGYDGLDAEQIRARLRQHDTSLFPGVDVVPVIDSTNQHLMQKALDTDVHGQALFAEYQSAGRGRRGDRWLSPPGSGLCFSIGWRFDSPPAAFSALGLVVGLALIRCLHQYGITEAGLKWPNDVVVGERKMAGILIEMRAEISGPSTTVIGIGLNVALSEAGKAMIDRPVDDFNSLNPQAEVNRSALAAQLLIELGTILRQFAEHGFQPFRHDWLSHDALRDRPVVLIIGQRRVEGIARGVDDYGALRIEHNGQHESFVSGHIELKH